MLLLSSLKVIIFKVFKGLVSVRLLKVLKVLKVLKLLKLLKVLKGMEHSGMSVSRYGSYFFFGVRKLSGCKVILMSLSVLIRKCTSP